MRISDWSSDVCSSDLMTLFTPALKPLLQAPGALLAPGIYDSFSALIAQQAGFKAAYLSGASIAYTRLGRSDVGLTTYTEVEQTLSRISDRVQLDRKSVVSGKSVYVRVDLGGRRIFKKTNHKHQSTTD